MKALNRERKLNLALIDQLFPPKVAALLRAGKPLLPEAYQDVTIFFSDVEGFTKMSAAVPPIQVIPLIKFYPLILPFISNTG
jgi:class 3 adenylate cyclase